MVSYVQSQSANFVSAYYRITTWSPQKKKAGSSFQYLSAKFALFWFWSHPITKLETDIQKWLWPELPKRLTYLPRQLTGCICRENSQEI